MRSDKWHRVRELFESVCDLDSKERAARLDEACDGDAELRAEIESLIHAHHDVPGFFQTPGMGSAAEWFPAEDAASRVGEQVGAYRLERLIASGGMGTVYEAVRTDGEYEKTVAIKLINPGMVSRDMLRRFRIERQALAKLDHPYIGRLLDGGVASDDAPYLVMEYIDGVPIDVHCDAARFTLPKRLELFRKVCMAVHYAHQRLVVHRDIKPTNILVMPDGTPKLLDFGIAKILQTDLAGRGADVTTTRVRSFTPDVASPEQIRGDVVTTAVDIYSLGVVLYTLLAGHRPYCLDNRTLSEIEKIVCEQIPPRPSTAVVHTEDVLGCDGQIRRTIDPVTVSTARGTTPLRLRRRLRGELDNIVMMAMRQEPQRRYGSAEQFANDIDCYLRGMPIAAGRDTIRYRFAKLVKRNKIATAATAVAVLSVVVGLISTTWQAREAHIQRDIAQANQFRAEKVSEFLTDLFAVSDPDKAPGEMPTARDLLDEGARRIDTELADEPIVRAGLMQTMGVAFMNLGVYDRAETLLQETLTIVRRELGPVHHHITTALIDLALVRTKTGDYESAEALEREALTMLRSIYGETHEAIAQCFNNLGTLLHRTGKLDEAEPLLRDALDMRKELLGDDDPKTATTRNNLAGVLFSTGDYDGAEALLREALAASRKALGDEHPGVATTLGNLALVLHANGDLDTAEKYHQQALEIRRRVLGDRHVDVANSYNNLGGINVDRGDYAAAEKYFRKALPILRAVHDDQHPAVTRQRANLALVLLYRGKHAEAERLLTEALEMASNSLPDDHPEVAAMRALLAELLVDTGRAQEAEQPLRLAMRIIEENFSPQHWRATGAKGAYGRCLSALQRFDEAEPLLLECYRITLETDGENHPRTRRAARAVIKHYNDRGQPERADQWRAAPGR
ncbi:MAG: serine/threonine protein kinase [Planctomycetes bacterium]|nr:serine/threonine protein kinase [Planctomycetota bacterium]